MTTIGRSHTPAHTASDAGTVGLATIGWRRGGLGYDVAHARWSHARQVAAAFGARGAVLLRTCERVDVLVDDVSAAPPEWLTDPDVDRVGGGAVLGIMRTAAGLDSRMLGETHVLGQVRNALEAARADGVITPRLGRLVEQAIRVGRRVRSQTALGAVAAGYATASARAIARWSGQRVQATPTVGVIGSGALARDVGRAIRDACPGPAVELFARHPERARPIASLIDAGLHSLDELPLRLDRLDAIIAATSAPSPLIEARTILSSRPRHGRALLLIDLGQPANIAPDAATIPGVRRLDLDDLAHAEAHRIGDPDAPGSPATVVEQAESIVRHAADAWIAAESRRRTRRAAECRA